MTRVGQLSLKLDGKCILTLKCHASAPNLTSPGKFVRFVNVPLLGVKNGLIAGMM